MARDVGSEAATSRLPLNLNQSGLILMTFTPMVSRVAKEVALFNPNDVSLYMHVEEMRRSLCLNRPYRNNVLIYYPRLAIMSHLCQRFVASTKEQAMTSVGAVECQV